MGFKNKKITNIVPGSETLQQTYDKEPGIKDVLVFKTNVFPDDLGGWFKETVRLNDQGEIQALKEQGVSLQVRQSNMSFIAPQGKRFWHIHPKQTEVWTTNSTLLVGLIDFRKNSPTYNQKQKVVLSPDRALYIPAGVAHGFLNPNLFTVTLVYFADQQFVADDTTQEYRVNPKDIPFDFVEPDLM